MHEDITFVPFAPDQAGMLADWLSSDHWPFHRESMPSRESILERVAAGGYANPRTRTFWMMRGDGEPVGVIQLRDIGDSTPVFDLRIGSRHRGTGLGMHALRWLTSYLFLQLPDIRRIEGTTRADNVAMRKLFGKCGYAKEAYYRQAWPTGSEHYDAVGYAILRDDWLRGTVTLPGLDDESY